MCICRGAYGEQDDEEERLEVEERRLRVWVSWVLQVGRRRGVYHLEGGCRLKSARCATVLDLQGRKLGIVWVSNEELVLQDAE